MIYEFIKNGLQAVEGLQGNVFPVTVNVDEIDGAFAVYNFGSSIPINDMMGQTHHYATAVDVDFIGPLYDELHDLYRQASVMLTASNLDAGHGEYIFSSVCSSVEPEQFDPDSGLFRRPMQVGIDWCLLEEDE